MDSWEQFEEGTLVPKSSTNTRKRKDNVILKIGPNQLTAEIPADWLDGENINSLSETWAVNTYDLYRFFQRKVRDTRFHVPMFAQGFMLATTDTCRQYINFVQKKIEIADFLQIVDFMEKI